MAVSGQQPAGEEKKSEQERIYFRRGGSHLMSGPVMAELHKPRKAGNPPKPRAMSLRSRNRGRYS